MKYRIVERNDGTFETQFNKFIFWKYVDSDIHLECAKKSLKERIDYKRKQLNYKFNSKIKKIIEEVEV